MALETFEKYKVVRKCRVTVIVNYVYWPPSLFFFWVSIFSVYPFRVRILCIGCLLCSQMIFFRASRVFFPPLLIVFWDFVVLFFNSKRCCYQFLLPWDSLPFSCPVEHPLHLPWGTTGKTSHCPSSPWLSQGKVMYCILNFHFTWWWCPLLVGLSSHTNK